MPPLIATVLFTAGIVGLFVLDQGWESNTSKAFWIVVVYFLIESSRPVGIWLGMEPNGNLTDIYQEGSPVDRAVLLCFISACVAILIARRVQVGALLRQNGAVLLFFMYGAFSILWSDFPFVTFKHWVKGVFDVIVVLVILTGPDTVGAFKRLTTTVGFILLPYSVLLCKYYPNLGRIVDHSWMEEYVGVTIQKNSLGLICLIYGLALLWRFQETYRDRENPYRARQLVALGAVLAMVVWLLATCDSMNAISCFIMMGAVMLLAVRPAFRWRPSRTHLLVAGVVGISVLALFFDRNLVTLLGRDTKLTGRIYGTES